MSILRSIAAPAALLICAGCMAPPLELELPERRADEKATLIAVQHGSQRRLYGIGDERVKHELGVSEGDEVHALFLTQTLQETRIAAGWSEEGSDDEMLGALGAQHIERARVERDGVSAWVSLDLPPPWLSTFKTKRPPPPPPPPCEYTAWHSELEIEQNHVAGMVRWDDAHVLVATGTWGTTIVGRDGSQQVLSHELDFSTNTAFRDGQGRVWIGGSGGELTRIEHDGPTGAKITPVLPRRAPQVPTIIHMDGGDASGKTELIAVSFDQKLMTYSEGDEGWQVYEQPTPTPCIFINCDVQRVAWLRPGVGLMVDRGPDMVEIDHGKVGRLGFRGCVAVTMIERLEDRRMIMGCSASNLTSFVELDEGLTDIGSHVFDSISLLPFTAAAQRGDILVAGQAGSWTAFRNERECETVSFSANDVAFVVPVSNRLLALSEWKTDVGGAVGREPPQVIWWVEWAP